MYYQPLYSNHVLTNLIVSLSLRAVTDNYIPLWNVVGNEQIDANRHSTGASVYACPIWVLELDLHCRVRYSTNSTKSQVFMACTLHEPIITFCLNLGSGIGKSGGNRKLSRKQARKQERDGKKQRKAEFSNGARPQHKTEGKRLADEEHADSLSRKKRRLSSNAPQAFVKVIHATSPKSMVESKPSSRVAKKKTSVPDKLEGRSEKVRVANSTLKTPLQRLAERTGADHPSSRHVDPLAIGRSQGEKEEDAYIAYLEKKLGWSKGGTRTKKYGSGLDEDGLDGELRRFDHHNSILRMNIC